MMRALRDLILIKVETSGVLKAGEGVSMKTEAGRIFRSIPGGKIHRLYKADNNGSINLKILQMAAKMSREVAEACERINWAGVEEVRMSFFSRGHAFLKAKTVLLFGLVETISKNSIQDSSFRWWLQCDPGSEWTAP